MDLNTRSQEYLDREVVLLHQDCIEARATPDTHRSLALLKPGGCLIAMGPNIRFMGGAYWDFWRHYLDLTECSLAEGMRILGFQIEGLVDSFLTYTMVNRRKIPSALIALYWKLPFLWKILGKQFLVVARKPC